MILSLPSFFVSRRTQLNNQKWVNVRVTYANQDLCRDVTALVWQQISMEMIVLWLFWIILQTLDVKMSFLDRKIDKKILSKYAFKEILGTWVKRWELGVSGGFDSWQTSCGTVHNPETAKALLRMHMGELVYAILHCRGPSINTAESYSLELVFSYLCWLQDLSSVSWALKYNSVYPSTPVILDLYYHVDRWCATPFCGWWHALLMLITL